VARFYPERAQRLEVEGRATISCSVTAKGTVTDCSVVSEEPADAGFGDAALKMARLFKMKPQTRDGAPVEGASVRIPLSFRLPK
jgi:protein TonB